MNDTRGFSLSVKPSPALRPWVRMLWYVADPHVQGQEWKLPAIDSQLLFNLDTDALGQSLPEAAHPHTVDGAALATNTHRAALLDRRQQRRLAGIVLRAGALPILFGMPAFILGTESIISLEALWGERARRLRQRCLDAVSPREVLRVLDSALCEAVAGDRDSWDPARALWLFTQGRAVEDVADALGYSIATLRRRFHRATGVSPKRAQRLARLNNAINLLGEHDDLAGVAQQLGYCDQAHFTHDFADLTGLTPGGYRAAHRHKPFHIAV